MQVVHLDAFPGPGGTYPHLVYYDAANYIEATLD